MGIYCGGKGWCGVLIVVAEVKKVRRGGKGFQVSWDTVGRLGVSQRVV